MSKQFAVFHISWRDAPRAPVGLFANERDYGRAAAAALQARLNELADEGWIVQDIIQSPGVTPRLNASYTVIVFR